jgi:hypothetical protein
MTKRILSAAAMLSLLLLPVALGDFAVGPTGAEAAVPEPGTLSLLTVGVAGIALSRWRRRR